MMIGSCKVYMVKDGNGGVKAFPSKALAAMAAINLAIGRRKSHFTQWLALHDMKDSLQTRGTYLSNLVEPGECDVAVIKVKAKTAAIYTAACLDMIGLKEDNDGELIANVVFTDGSESASKAKRKTKPKGDPK